MQITLNPKITKTEIILVEEESITIKLSKDEAGMLAAIFGKIGGNMERFNTRNAFYDLIDFIGKGNYNNYVKFYTGGLTCHRDQY